MDIQSSLQEEADLKEQLAKMTQKLDELYEIKEEADIALRVYWLDDKHIHGELFTPEYNKIFKALCIAQDDVLDYEKVKDKVETSYINLSTKLRKLGY